MTNATQTPAQDSSDAVLDPVVQRFSDLYDNLSTAIEGETTQLKALVAEMRQHTTNVVQIKSAGVDKLNAIADRFDLRIKAISSLSNAFSDSVADTVAAAPPAPTAPVVEEPAPSAPTPVPAPAPEPQAEAAPTPAPTPAPEPAPLSEALAPVAVAEPAPTPADPQAASNTASASPAPTPSDATPPPPASDDTAK